MKNLYKFFVVLGFFFTGPSFYLSAHVGINGDNTPPDNSAMLDVKSTTRGFLPPRMTTMEMNSIITPSQGLLVYNITVNSLFCFNGSTWKQFNEPYTETDPVFTAHPAYGITTGSIGNWNAAYGWGNHATAGYLTSYTETDPTISAWAKAGTKPTYSYSEVGAAPSSTVSFPGFGTTVSTAANGNHTHAGVYLTGYTETDPTIYAWAKAAAKPSYSKSEVGLGNVDNTADASKSVSYANSAGSAPANGGSASYATTAGSAPASDVYAWAKAAAKPSYSASEVGLGNVNNTADASKSVSYAGTAGSAPANGGTSAACSGNSATATNFNNGSAYSSGGTVTAVTFTETSARKYKHDIAPMSPQMANIMKLNPVDYVLNLTGKKDKGFIADEIIKVYPEFADSTGVNYSKIVSVLVKGMQEQQLQIDQLKKEIELLKSK